MNDRDMSQIQTKEFNKIVKKSGCDKDRTAWLKQRRRTLKNRLANYKYPETFLVDYPIHVSFVFQ